MSNTLLINGECKGAPEHVGDFRCSPTCTETCAGVVDSADGIAPGYSLMDAKPCPRDNRSSTKQKMLTGGQAHPVGQQSNMRVQGEESFVDAEDRHALGVGNRFGLSGQESATPGSNSFVGRSGDDMLHGMEVDMFPDGSMSEFSPRNLDRTGQRWVGSDSSEIMEGESPLRASTPMDDGEGELIAILETTALSSALAYGNSTTLVGESWSSALEGGSQGMNMTLGESRGDSTHEPTVHAENHTPEGPGVGEEAGVPLGDTSNQTHRTDKAGEQDASWRRSPNRGEEGIMEGRPDEPGINSTLDEPPVNSDISTPETTWMGDSSTSEDGAQVQRDGQPIEADNGALVLRDGRTLTVLLPQRKHTLLPCKFCILSFKGPHQLDMHVRDRHRGARIISQCTMCEKVYKSVHAGACHVPRCRGKAVPQDGGFECEGCDRKFRTKRGRSQHCRIAHPELANIARRKSHPNGADDLELEALLVKAVGRTGRFTEESVLDLVQEDVGTETFSAVGYIAEHNLAVTARQLQAMRRKVSYQSLRKRYIELTEEPAGAHERHLQ